MQEAASGPRKWPALTGLAVAELLAMTLWFSASAVVPQLTAEWNLDGGAQAWITMSVQVGFVIGAVLSALLNLADRVPARRLFAISAIVGAGANAAIVAVGSSIALVIGLRILTGIALAGVYPPGMKLVATWCKTDRGFGIGLLVGALTLGSATPHLISGLPAGGGLPAWRTVLLTSSILAVVAAALMIVVKRGPYLGRGAPFDWRQATRGLLHRPTRLANFGYLGHMWELYAMWAWVPALLLYSYQDAGWSAGSARIAAFAVIGMGAVGCILAGLVADRLGRTSVTIAALVVSGSCALVAGFLAASPLLLTSVCLIWGFAVVADSAQFSAAVSELAESDYVGTALTVQTSLGFLLTLVSIRLVPLLVDHLGWGLALATLAAGPLFGIWSMWQLRQMPEAKAMASGNR